MRIKCRVVKVLRFSVWVIAQGRTVNLPRSLELLEGEYQKGAAVVIQIPRKMAEKKGLA